MLREREGKGEVYNLIILGDDGSLPVISEDRWRGRTEERMGERGAARARGKQQGRVREGRETPASRNENERAPPVCLSS